jgi:hypothetical protein
MGDRSVAKRVAAQSKGPAYMFRARLEPANLSIQFIPTLSRLYSVGL